MNNVDVIVCYNNEQLYKEMKESICSRGGYGVQWNIIAIDNTHNAFKSAAAAYNYAFTKSTAECIVFCHQDILFLENSLYTITEKCMSEPDTLWGAAGVKEKGNIISSMATIKEGWNYHSLKPGEAVAVQTLDECLIAANRHLFDKFHFDEEVCDGWHLYAVELSCQCIVANHPVKVFDANIVHLSGGNMDQSFFDTEKKLAKKYRGGVLRKIYTTNCWTYTNPILFFLLRLYRAIRYKIN